MTAPRPDAFVDALFDGVGGRDGPFAGRSLPLHEPDLTEAEAEAVAACVRTGFVSSVGASVDALEQNLADYTGAAAAVVVVNGTAALEVAYRLAGVAAGDLVISPSATFVATGNAIAHLGASPAFVDVEEETLGLDPRALRAFLETETTAAGGGRVHTETGRRCAAIALVHIFGNPARAHEIAAIAEEFGVPLVEDAAESLGARVDGRHTGRFGVAAALSFNGNKVITTGGGGALLFEDPALAARAKHLTTTAKRPHPWEYWHDEVGYNYRMPNLNAALGCAQLARLDLLLAQKATVHAQWRAAMATLDGATLIEARAGTEPNHWLNAVRVDVDDLESRDALLAAAIDAGFYCRPLWVPLHKLPGFEGAPSGPLPTTERLEREVICLPSSAYLAEASS